MSTRVRVPRSHGLLVILVAAAVALLGYLAAVDGVSQLREAGWTTQPAHGHGHADDTRIAAARESGTASLPGSAGRGAVPAAPPGLVRPSRTPEVSRRTSSGGDAIPVPDLHARKDDGRHPRPAAVEHSAVVSTPSSPRAARAPPCCLL